MSDTDVVAPTTDNVIESSESIPTVTPVHSSVAALAAAAAAQAPTAQVTPVKEERKIGKLNMAAFAANSESTPDKATPSASAGKGQPGKLKIGLNIPMFSPSAQPPKSTGEGGTDGAAPAPRKLQANSLMSNLNAMLGAKTPTLPKPATAAASEEDAAGKEQKEETAVAVEEAAPSITHAKRAKVSRKARTKPTELAKAGVTSGFERVQTAEVNVGAITIESVAPAAAAAVTPADAALADNPAAAAAAAAAADGSKPAESSGDTVPAAAASASQTKESESETKSAAAAAPAPIPIEDESKSVATADVDKSAADTAPADIPATFGSIYDAGAPAAAASSSVAPSPAASSAAAPIPIQRAAPVDAFAALYGDYEAPAFDESKADDYRMLTAAGAEFLKHGEKGKPHPRLVYVTSALLLLWVEPGKKSKGKPDLKQSINLSLATVPKIAVVKGKTTENLKRATKSNPDHCLSIINARERSALDLEAKTVEDRDAWHAAISFLLHEAQLARERALVYGAMGPPK
jgi:hypothetical protein